LNYTIQERDEFFKNIIKTKRSDDGVEHCWVWHGKHDKLGYGIFKTKESSSPHRFSYMLHKGEILEGLEIDHICENRACANPNHLEAVSRTENMRRIWSRQDTISLLYNISNTEYDIIIDDTPLSPRIKQCIEYLEGGHYNIGRIRFPDDAFTGNNLGKKAVIDMMSLMLTNKGIIFRNQEMYSDELVCGYKEKWFLHFFQGLTHHFDDISFKEVFDYYRPELIANGLDRYNSSLDDKIDELIAHLKFLGITTTSQIKESIKEKEIELEELRKKLDERE